MQWMKVEADIEIEFEKGGLQKITSIEIILEHIAIHRTTPSPAFYALSKKLFSCRKCFSGGKF